MRVNCIDNLDRTNVVQSLFARHAAMLSLTGKASENVLEAPYKDFEKQFKNSEGAASCLENYGGIQVYSLRLMFPSLFCVLCAPRLPLHTLRANRSVG